MTRKQRASCLFDKRNDDLEESEKTALDGIKYKAYATLRDSECFMAQSQRDYISSLYGKHYELLGNDFSENFKKDYYAGMWKLALCEFIRSHEKIKLSVPAENNSNSSPDYLIKIDDKEFHVCLISCNPSIEDTDNPQGHDSNYYKSFCNALSEDSKHKTSMNDDAGCIIAISLAWIPLDRFGFGVMDELTCSLQPDDNEDIIKLRKSNAKDLKRFLEENTHISAILVLPTHQMFYPAEERYINPNYTKSTNIYCLFHNPSTNIPFPENQLSTSFEYTKSQHNKCHPTPTEGLKQHHKSLKTLHRMIYGDNETESWVRGLYDEIFSSIDNHITYSIIAEVGRINEAVLQARKNNNLTNFRMDSSGVDLKKNIEEKNKIRDTIFLTQNPHFYHFFTSSYFYSQLTAIRRLVDTQSGVNSFEKVLVWLRNNTTKINKNLNFRYQFDSLSEKLVDLRWMPAEERQGLIESLKTKKNSRHLFAQYLGKKTCPIDKNSNILSLKDYINDFITHTKFKKSDDNRPDVNEPDKAQYTHKEMVNKIEEFHHTIFNIFRTITGYAFGCYHDDTLRTLISERDDQTLIKCLLLPSADALTVATTINELESWKERYIDSILKR